MYAMIMSTINFGSLVSTQLGGLLTYLLGITEDNFDKLWLLVLISNLSTAVPLIWINLINQKGKKLSDSDLSSSSSEKSENASIADKDEVKSERSSLVDEANGSTNYKAYGTLNQTGSVLPESEMLNVKPNSAENLEVKES